MSSGQGQTGALILPKTHAHSFGEGFVQPLLRELLAGLPRTRNALPPIIICSSYGFGDTLTPFHVLEHHPIVPRLMSMMSILSITVTNLAHLQHWISRPSPPQTLMYFPRTLGKFMCWWSSLHGRFFIRAHWWEFLIFVLIF